ncbi:MAG TPA: immunoglobulin domain-containing protein [Candidatus Acidoferrum sp.]|nr:immunoglobulin domain-containing protein [Candidatus Acidoferrum sp.]
MTNTTDTAVSWSVSGVAGGNAQVGTITAGGVYTAPADLPSPTLVQITATSHADSTKSGSASITITSDIVLVLMPNSANVELGATQAFQASISSGGHPDPAVRWSLSGAASPSACGAVDSSGHYTAPGIPPSPANVTLTAQSAADPSKLISAAITITSSFTLQLAAPSSVLAGDSATLAATLTPIPNSNPSTVLAWSLSGTGCSGSSCGTLTVVTTQSAGGATSNSATYTAPATAPTPNTVTVTVTPQADPSKQAQAAIAIQPGVSVSISPQTDTLAVNHRVTLTVQVNGTSNPTVTWSVDGAPGGNSTLGQICAVGSNPCQTVTTSFATQVDYVAPGAIPSPNPVSVTAVSAADTTKSASPQITVINHVLVSVQPASVTLAPLAVQAFTASVLGTSNQAVVWQVQGTACSTAGACGTVDANGIYTAPSAAPSPDAIQVVAISSDDTTQSGAANVTISTGTNILALHPSSVYAGAADGFTLRVDGSGFVSSSPGPGSALLIGGTARTTSCASVLACTAPVTATDVALAGNVSVQVQNPDGTSSNAVSLVVATPNPSDEVIPLSSSSPSATGKDIIVVDPTTAGVSTPGNDLDLNVAALGAFSTASNSCTLGGNPIPLQRPASGTATADICLFSQSGFDASMTYTVSGPGDVAVIAKQPAGLGIIHLTLQVPASAAPGARTLFIQTTNLDKTAASGALEVR